MLIPRKYYSSPTQFVLALLLIIAIIVNIIIYQLNHHSLPTGAYTPDGNIASAESYLLKPGSSVQSWINDVYNPEFWDSFAAELKTEKANEILLQLKTSVKKTHYQELLDELRETIRKEKYEEFTTQLMSQIQHQYTENYIRTVTNSYSLFEELKQEYLESHEKEIKDELLNELSNNENSVDTKLDKKSYYKYILKDLLLANGPSRSPITNQELADIDPIHVGNPELFSAIPKMGLNSLKMKDLSDAHEIVTKLLYNLQAPPFFKGDGIVILLSSDPSSSFDESIAQVMLNIKQIRNLGAKLPIEVVFPNNDIDARIQHYLQDNFDVKCLSIEKEIGSEVYTEILLQREVALNPIALLISSFDNIITIHSQSIPVQNVDDLLSKKTFLNTKWLFWANTWGEQPHKLSITLQS